MKLNDLRISSQQRRRMVTSHRMCVAWCRIPAGMRRSIFLKALKQKSNRAEEEHLVEEHLVEEHLVEEHLVEEELLVYFLHQPPLSRFFPSPLFLHVSIAATERLMQGKNVTSRVLLVRLV